jgi:hypothetical protein
MRYLFSILLLLLSVVSANAEGFVIGSGAASCADSSCTGFLVCQNLEGTGYDNSETWTEGVGSNCTVDEDDTTATPRGSQDLKISTSTSPGTCLTRTSFTAGSSIYYHIRFKAAAIGVVADIGGLRDSTNTTQLHSITLLSTGALRSIDGSQTASTSGTLSAGVWYHIWGYYQKGTGSNSVHSVEFTADNVRTPTGSGSGYATGTAGTSTADAGIIRFLQTSENITGHYHDQVLVKSTSIGTVCE